MVIGGDAGSHPQPDDCVTGVVPLVWTWRPWWRRASVRIRSALRWHSMLAFDAIIECCCCSKACPATPCLWPPRSREAELLVCPSTCCVHTGSHLSWCGCRPSTDLLPQREVIATICCLLLGWLLVTVVWSRHNPGRLPGRTHPAAVEIYQAATFAASIGDAADDFVDAEPIDDAVMLGLAESVDLAARHRAAAPTAASVHGVPPHERPVPCCAPAM